MQSMGAKVVLFEPQNVEQGIMNVVGAKNFSRLHHNSIFLVPYPFLEISNILG
jgi:hypothetical protein